MYEDVLYFCNYMYMHRRCIRITRICTNLLVWVVQGTTLGTTTTDSTSSSATTTTTTTTTAATTTTFEPGVNTTSEVAPNSTDSAGSLVDVESQDYMLYEDGTSHDVRLTTTTMNSAEAPRVRKSILDFARMVSFLDLICKPGVNANPQVLLLSVFIVAVGYLSILPANRHFFAVFPLSITRKIF